MACLRRAGDYHPSKWVPDQQRNNAAEAARLRSSGHANAHREEDAVCYCVARLGQPLRQRFRKSLVRCGRAAAAVTDK